MILDSYVMGRSEQNSSNGINSWNGFLFLIAFHKQICDRNRRDVFGVEIAISLRVLLIPTKIFQSHYVSLCAKTICSNKNPFEN